MAIDAHFSIEKRPIASLKIRRMHFPVRTIADIGPGRRTAASDALPLTEITAVERQSLPLNPSSRQNIRSHPSLYKWGTNNAADTLPQTFAK
jgi:hypothetical protein